jgi:phytoene dehydrogenase-like protein
VALREAGVLDRVELLPLEPAFHAVFPEHRFDASCDPERFRQELSVLWPAEAPAIQRFFQDIAAIGKEFLTLVDGMPAAGPLAAQHGRTLGQFLDDYTQTEELRAALSSLWLFGGLPPERLSLVHYAMLWDTYLLQGSATVKGGVKALTQALADAITERGGIVETKVQVKQIVRRGGHVTGAILEDGREYVTSAVISTAGPQVTFDELLEAEGQPPAGYPALRKGYAFSISAMQVHLLVNGPLTAPARTTLLHSTYDLHSAYVDLQREEAEITAMACTVLDHGDPGRVPEGKHMLSLFTLAPYTRADRWHVDFDLRRTKDYRTLPDYIALREEYGDAMVEAAEELFPGLSGQVEARKIGTPITMERYTFNTGGAAYGWSNTPDQSGANRPGPHTPFKGLYMAGAWNFPGGSIAGAMTSGRIAAKVILAGG